MFYNYVEGEILSDKLKYLAEEVFKQSIEGTI